MVPWKNYLLKTFLLQFALFYSPANNTKEIALLRDQLNHQTNESAKLDSQIGKYNEILLIILLILLIFIYYFIYIYI